MKNTHREQIGDAILIQNDFCNNWHVSGQKDAPYKTYACKTYNDAVAMAKTINHFNQTGEIKDF